MKRPSEALQVSQKQLNHCVKNNLSIALCELESSEQMKCQQILEDYLIMD